MWPAVNPTRMLQKETGCLGKKTIKKLITQTLLHSSGYYAHKVSWWTRFFQSSFLRLLLLRASQKVHPQWISQRGPLEVTAPYNMGNCGYFTPYKRSFVHCTYIHPKNPGRYVLRWKGLPTDPFLCVEGMGWVSLNPRGGVSLGFLGTKWL